MRKVIAFSYLLLNIFILFFAYYIFSSKKFYDYDLIVDVILSKLIPSSAGSNIDYKKENILIVNLDKKYFSYIRKNNLSIYNKLFDKLSVSSLVIIGNEIFSNDIYFSSGFKKLLGLNKILIGLDNIPKHLKFIGFEKYSNLSFIDYAYLNYKYKNKNYLPLPYLVYVKTIPGDKTYKLKEIDGKLIVSSNISKLSRQIPIVKPGYIFSSNFPLKHITTVSAYELVSGKINIKKIENKVVFLSKDVIKEKTLSNISNYLAYKYDAFYSIVSYKGIYYFILVFFVFLIYLYFFYKNINISLILSLILLFGIIIFYILIYINTGLFLAIISLISVVMLKIFIDLIFLIIFLIYRKYEISKLFSEYVSSDVLEKKSENLDKNISEKLSAYILFTDIENFTTFSEKLRPYEVLKILEKYFSIFGLEIKNNKGKINKYIGDAILAYWEYKDNKFVDNILLSLLRLKKKSNELSISLKKELGININIKTRFGLHFGEVIVGDVGSGGLKLDYTILGDVVNTASRLESLNKYYGTYILTSQEVIDHIKDKSKFLYRVVDKVVLKGKTSSTKIYEIIGVNIGDKDYIGYIRTFEKVIYYYLSGDFKKAFYLAIEISKTKYGKNDKPLITIIKRLEYLISNPPLYWDGLRRYDTK